MIPAQPIFSTFIGDGVTTVFALATRIYLAADVQVYTYNPGVDTVPQLATTGYTATVAGDFSGADVTFAVAPSSGVKVGLIRRMDLTQDVAISDTNYVPPSVVEKQLDRQVMMAQEAALFSTLALETDPFDFTATARVGKVVAFDSNGDPTVGPSSADLLATKAAAAASAAAAAASAVDAAVSDTGAAASETAAAASAAAAAASASAINLPSPIADTFLQRNAGNTAYDAKTGAAVLAAIGAATAAQGALAATALQPAIAQSINITGTFSLTNLGGTSPANGVYAGVGGNSLSFQTRFSSPSDGGADIDNQRGSLLLAATTSDDGNSEEQTLCVLTTIQTGYAKAWAVSTAYALGDNIRIDTANAIYRCITAGTSAASGTGPTGNGTNITDGTVHWMWINDAVVDAKVGIYNETDVKAGAGSVWAQAHNIRLNSGYLGTFAVNTELDFANNGVDAAIGGPNFYNLYIQTNGTKKSTASVAIGSSNASAFANFWGLYLSGAKLASKAVIGVDASSDIGLGFGSSGGGVVATAYTTATIKDSSTAPSGLLLAGTYSSQAIGVTGTTAASLASSGTRTLASIYDATISPVGVSLNGTYATSQIAGTGWSVSPSGAVKSTVGIGYAPGAGGTVAQATSKGTTVVLNDICGQVTMNAAALAANTNVNFILTNSAIAATDIIILNHVSGGTGGSYALNAQAAAGSALINVRNITAGSLSEAIVIGFAVIKAVNA